MHGMETFTIYYGQFDDKLNDGKHATIPLLFFEDNKSNF